MKYTRASLIEKLTDMGIPVIAGKVKKSDIRRVLATSTSLPDNITFEVDPTYVLERVIDYPPESPEPGNIYVDYEVQFKYDLEDFTYELRGIRKYDFESDDWQPIIPMSEEEIMLEAVFDTWFRDNQDRLENDYRRKEYEETMLDRME